MIKVFLSLIFFSAFLLNSTAQANRFKEAVKKDLIKTDVLCPIVSKTAMESSFNFMTSDLRHVEELVLSNMLKNSKNKINVLKESKALSQLSLFCTNFWSNSVYSKAKKWKSMQLHLNRALRNVETSYGLIQSTSFRINLVDNNKGRFYYDSKGEKGQLNLFKGSKPITKKEKEEHEQVPLEFLTEGQIIEQVSKLLRNRHIYSGLDRGLFYCTGISIQIDKKSLFRNKIPTARIVVICGARRLHLIDKKKRIK